MVSFIILATQLGLACAVKLQQDPNATQLQADAYDGPCESTRAHCPKYQTRSVVTSVSAQQLPNIYRNCALVGSTASLSLLGRRPEIDAHHTVIRVNRLPTPEAYIDLGDKSDILFQNLSNTRDVAKGQQGFRWDHVQFSQWILESPCDSSARAELETAVMPFANKSKFAVGIQKQVHADLICAMRDAHGDPPKTTEFYAFIIFSQICDYLEIYGFAPHTGPGGVESINYADHAADFELMKSIIAHGVTAANFAGGIEPDNPMYPSFRDSLSGLSSFVTVMPEGHGTRPWLR